MKTLTMIIKTVTAMMMMNKMMTVITTETYNNKDSQKNSKQTKNNKKIRTNQHLNNNGQIIKLHNKTQMGSLQQKIKRTNNKRKYNCQNNSSTKLRQMKTVMTKKNLNNNSLNKKQQPSHQRNKQHKIKKQMLFRQSKNKQ